MKNENFSINLWAFWKSINFNNCKSIFTALLLILFFGLNAIAQETSFEKSNQYEQNQLSVDETQINNSNSDTYKSGFPCKPQWCTVNYWYNWGYVGWVKYLGDGWFFVGGKNIYIWLEPSQWMCNFDFWFYTDGLLCNNSGWFYTSDGTWFFNGYTNWFKFWECPYRVANPNQNDFAKSLVPDIAIPPVPLINPPERENRSNKEIGNRLDFDNKLNDMFVYPNPVSDRANITYTLLGEEQISIDVYDVNGKHQINLLPNKVQTAGKHELQFDGSDLPIGVYYIRIQSNEFLKTQKVVISR